MDTHAVVVADTAGVIRLWSIGAERLFGYDVETALGQTLDLIVPAEYRERHWTGFRAAMSAGNMKLDGAAANIPVLCRDGGVRRFPGRFMCLRDAVGHMVGAMVIFAPYDEHAADLYNL
jgi:PAS domain S-box-containing protein